MKEYDIKNAVPEYTGGGIYAMTGQLTDGNYFMSDITFYWAVVVNEAPDWDDSWYEEWIDAHKVEDLCEADARTLIKTALEWVKANKPDGNYLMSDMDDILADLNESIVLSSKDLAEKHDDFDADVLTAIHKLAERICGKELDGESLSYKAYDLGIMPQIEELAKQLIEESFDFHYDSDGTSF